MEYEALPDMMCFASCFFPSMLQSCQPELQQYVDVFDASAQQKQQQQGPEDVVLIVF